MKIGKPVRESEIPVSCRQGKHGPVWQVAKELVGGDALPVLFSDTKAAISFRSNTNTARGMGLKLTLRGTTVYVTRAK